MEPTSDRPPFGPPPGWGPQPQPASSPPGWGGQPPAAGPPPGWGQQAPPWGQQPLGPGPVPAAGWGQPQGWGQQAGAGRGPVWQAAPPGMERRRRPVLLAIGLVLTTIGLAGLGFGIVRIVDAVRIPDDEIVGRSFVGGPPIEFERTDDQPDQFTIYLETGASNSDTTDGLVDATTCTITLPDGSSLRRDGNDLSMSVNLNGTANVGSFRTTSGTVSVSCTSGRADGESLLVAEGGPRLSLAAFGYLFGGVGLLVVGIILTIVGSIKRWRPIKRADTVT